MNVFISGGCKNGKSMHAQIIAREKAEKDGLPLYYVATMIPKDDEDRVRIARHLDARDGWGFQTLEQGENILKCLERSDVNKGGVFLLDSVTAVLSNEMFGMDGTFNADAGEKVAADLVEFAGKTGNTVFVSDYIYSDARIFDEYTECYRRALANCDRKLAKICDEVLEVSFGHVESLKQKGE